MGKRKKTEEDSYRAALREEIRAEVLAELQQPQRAEPAAAGGVPGFGFFTGPAFRTGAIGAAALLLAAENRDKLRPAVIGAMKEVLRFRDWLGANVSSLREDLTDMSAEAQEGHERELAEHLADLERERELLQRLQDVSKRRRAEKAQ